MSGLTPYGFSISFPADEYRAVTLVDIDLDGVLDRCALSQDSVGDAFLGDSWVGLHGSGAVCFADGQRFALERDNPVHARYIRAVCEEKYASALRRLR